MSCGTLCAVLPATGGYPDAGGRSQAAMRPLGRPSSVVRYIMRRCEAS